MLIFALTLLPCLFFFASILAKIEDQFTRPSESDFSVSNTFDLQDINSSHSSLKIEIDGLLLHFVMLNDAKLRQKAFDVR